MRRLAGWLLTASMVLAPPGLAGAREEPMVDRVEIRSRSELEEPTRIRELVELVPGEPLTESRIRDTLRSLYATGLATEIEVWSRPGAGDGVVAMIAVHPRIHIVEVRLEGRLGLDRREIRELIEPKVGQPLIESRILRTVFRLQDRYEEEGFLEASVRPSVETMSGTREAVVTFRIDSGPRATVGEVDLRGDLGPFTAPALRSRAKIESGNRYRRESVEEKIENLLRWLRQEGFRRAEAELGETSYDPGTSTVDVAVEISVGAEIRVRVIGADRERLRRKGFLPFLEEEGYDEVLVLQAVERIRRHFQEQGHYRVRVEREERRQGETLLLILRIDPGPVYRLTAVEFRGNDGMSDDRLQELMTTTPRRLLVPGSGRLVEATLEEDVDNLRSFYALQGWNRVEVGPPEIEEVEERDLKLVVPIREGPRIRLVGLGIEGNEAIPDEEALADLPLEPGGPFHRLLLEESLDRIRLRYERRGFAEARVSAGTDWNEERTLVDVEIRVMEGPQRRADHLIVRGNEDTETRVIRAAAGLIPGEPLSRERLLEIQRKLYQLGIFFRVEVGLAPPGDDPGRRDVVVRVVEGKTQRLAYGVGWDTEEGLGGLVGYSHANIDGRATRFQIDLRQSEKTERYRLLVSRPYNRGGGWPGTVTALLFQEDDDRPSFSVEQQGAQLELARTRNQDRLSLFFDYRQSDLALAPDVVLEDADLPPGQTGRDLRDIQIFSVIPRFVWDRRDDPLEPREGTQLTLQLQYALPVEEISTENFLKLFGQWVQYVPLGGGQVLAGSFRAGGIESLGSEPVSLAERFFAGGRTSHRAYERDGLGIPGESQDEGGRPVGGRGLLLVNLDYRFPIAGNVGGTLFVDGGNVWRDYRDVDPRGMKWGLGVGLRYRSPIGPLRLEWGWKLDREPGESPSEIFVSFGNAF